MPLIKCPECGKEISDKADVCIHCGYPIGKYGAARMEEPSEYSLILRHCGPNKVKCINEIRQTVGVGLMEAKAMCESSQEVVLEISKDKNHLDNIKSWFDGIQADTYITAYDASATMKERQVRCPRCGSTQIAIGQRGYSLFTGFLGSNKTMLRCASCGHSWEP